MKCKKSLMGFAAFLIVVFHFWMPLTQSLIETNLYRSTYIGVDLFFFVSAYTLAQRKELVYGSFLKNRLLHIYLPFVVLACISAIYKKWTLKSLLMVICGLEFFQRGGGSFLWFAVAIMLLYLVAPFMVTLKRKHSLFALFLFFAAWLLLACLLEFGFGYTTIFILINRLPIFILGLYYGDFRAWLQSLCQKEKALRFIVPLGIVLMYVLGFYLTLNYGASQRLSKPLTDFYYVLAIPLTLAIIFTFDDLSQRLSFSNHPLIFVGGFTLELYGLQMIFGFNIEMKLFQLLKSLALPLPAQKLVTFAATALILMLMAWLFSIIKTSIFSIFNKCNFSKKEAHK